MEIEFHYFCRCWGQDVAKYNAYIYYYEPNRRTFFIRKIFIKISTNRMKMTAYSLKVTRMPIKGVRTKELGLELGYSF